MNSNIFCCSIAQNENFENSEKKFEKNRENFFFRFFENFFRRNLPFDEQITHAKFHDHRLRGSGDTRGGHTDRFGDLLYRSLTWIFQKAHPNAPFAVADKTLNSESTWQMEPLKQEKSANNGQDFSTRHLQIVTFLASIFPRIWM